MNQGAFLIVRWTQKLFCDDNATDLDNIIAEKYGNDNWCINPNANKASNMH